MLNHGIREEDKLPTLTLNKHSAGHHQLSPLQACGSLEQNHSGIACTVYLKRSRTGGDTAGKLLQPGAQPKRNATTATVSTRGHRSRRGSYLRLASIRSH